MFTKIALWFALFSSVVSFGQTPPAPTIANEESLLRALVVARSIGEARTLLATNGEFITNGLYDRLDSEATRVYESGDYPRSLLLFEVEHEIAERLHDTRRAARSLHQIGRAFYAQGDTTSAINAYNNSRRVLDQTNSQDRLQVANLNALSNAYMQIDDYSRARECAEQSLLIATTIEYKQGMASAQLALGTINNWEGNYELALNHLIQSANLFTELNQQHYVVSALMQKGMAYRMMGNYIQALNHYNRAMELVNIPDQRIWMERLLASLSVLYADQGDYSRAIDYLNRSTQIAREINDRTGIFTNLVNLGAISLEQGNNQAALVNFQQSFRMAEELNRSELIIDAQGGLGAALHSLGRYELALNHLTRSLEVSTEIGSRPRTVVLLWQIARVYNSMGDHIKAVEFAERAVTLANQLNMAEMSYLSLTLQGEAHYARRDYDRARAAWTQAISRIEQLQTNVAGAEYAQQRFFENKLDPYHGMMSLLIEQSDPRGAFVYAERARARVLLDVLRRGRVNINRVLTVDERAEEGRLNAEIRSLNTQILVESHQQPADEQRLRELEEHLHRARANYEQLQTRLFARYPELAAQRGQIMPLTIEEASVVIPTGTAVLEYVVTENRTYLFALTKRQDGQLDLQVYPIDIRARELRARVASFLRQVSEQSPTISPAATRLYDLLVRPARQQIRNSTTICFIPDGSLWELPFQTLRAGSRYLIEDRAVFYAPSLSVLREMQRRQEGGATRDDAASDGALLAFGNPSLDNNLVERLVAVERGKRFDPIPQAGVEATISARTVGGRSMSYTEAAATESLFKRVAPDFRMLHIASHGSLDDTNPMYSFVLLTPDAGEDGLLEAREIMGMNLNAQLVVLSACETARGRVASGEGVIGMVWAFHVAGCPTTIASQWRVESESTSRLMTKFYRHYTASDFQAGTTGAKAEALRRASLGLLASEQFRHPYYWAGFVLVGDPR